MRPTYFKLFLSKRCF